MRNEQTKWLLNFALVMAVILLITLIFCQITNKPQISINQVPESKNITETDNEDLIFVDDSFTAWEMTSIVFGNNIGKLTWEDGKMKFEGDAYESAKIFFDYFLVMYIDDYIEARIEEEKELAITEPEMILFKFEAEGEFAKEFRPQLFLKITNTDLSRCLINGRLKLDLNGEIYWIRLEKDN